ncbi:hypothetical protein ASE92_11815 [Pedobacter sp. Leaf41]|uniref:AAA family ATPase n=1 Tax=Pedobacter sp. Leaf41 TaxID=1736218 RepID=UPI0007025E66|nr:AAA family ATPase [Pedobacter sp. Leaf41]KQN34291.1 hypothetical protein ASE92_11815 [Pedobacter sp. Leaf41]
MIRIEKQNAPKYLSSSIVDLAIEKMEEFFASKNRSQKRYDWPFNKEIDNELKKNLHVVFHGKCGYCETKIESPEIGTVDRYRPNNGVRDKNEYHQDLYWWLTFDWENLVYCCKECNQYKASYFPIKGIRATDEKSDLATEKRMLLNPYQDIPNQHFLYNVSGEIIPITENGLQTIELLRLNRSDLIRLRLEAKRETEHIIYNILEEVNENNRTLLEELKRIYYEESPDVGFSSYKKWVIENEADTDSRVARLLDFEIYNEPGFRDVDEAKRFISGKLYKNIIRNDYFPIEYIQIRNFKSIDELRVDFKEDDSEKKSWLILLGENGVGKSSILQAISIGLKVDKKVINEDIIRSLIKKRKQTAEIIIKERNSKNIIYTKLTRKTGTIEQDGDFNSYLIGYGSLRLSIEETEIISEKDTSKVSYENLFRPTKALNNVTKWLKSIHKNDITYFNSIAYSIKQLLPDDKSDTELAIKNGEIVLGDSEKLFSELSDGYKSTITLAIDIMMKLSDVQSDMEKMAGIVLIDELGNQLHPRWQMKIVSQLRHVFPNINFIISTHHPLCLRGAEKKEILLLRNLDDQVVITTELPDPASLRVDQILASEFFGLNSLIDPEIEAKFNRYYTLLAKNKGISLNEIREIDELKDFLRNKKQLGASLREELMYTVIDRLLAEKVVFNKNTFSRDSLKEEAVKRVKEVWKNLNLNTDD